MNLTSLVNSGKVSLNLANFAEQILVEKREHLTTDMKIQYRPTILILSSASHQFHEWNLLYLVINEVA